MMQIKCLHRYSVSVNSLNKHLLRTSSFRCRMVEISTKTKHNKTKRKKILFLIYLGRKKRKREYVQKGLLIIF